MLIELKKIMNEIWARGIIILLNIGLFFSCVILMIFSSYFESNLVKTSFSLQQTCEHCCHRWKPELMWKTQKHIFHPWPIAKNHWVTEGQFTQSPNYPHPIRQVWVKTTNEPSGCTTWKMKVLYDTQPCPHHDFVTSTCSTNCFVCVYTSQTSPV